MIEKDECMRSWFLVWLLLAKREKLQPFRKTQYVVCIIEHHIEFSLFDVNCYRNVPIEIIRNIIPFL